MMNNLCIISEEKAVKDEAAGVCLRIESKIAKFKTDEFDNFRKKLINVKCLKKAHLRFAFLKNAADNEKSVSTEIKLANLISAKTKFLEKIKNNLKFHVICCKKTQSPKELETRQGTDINSATKHPDDNVVVWVAFCLAFVLLFALLFAIQKFSVTVSLSYNVCKILFIISFNDYTHNFYLKYLKFCNLLLLKCCIKIYYLLLLVLQYKRLSI